MHSFQKAIPVAVLFAFAGCSVEPLEQAHFEKMEAYEEFVLLMEPVKDKAEADAVRPTLMELAKRIGETHGKVQLAKQGKPPGKVQEIVEAFNEKYRSRIDAVAEKQIAIERRCMSNPGLRELFDEFRETRDAREEIERRSGVKGTAGN